MHSAPRRSNEQQLARNSSQDNAGFDAHPFNDDVHLSHTEGRPKAPSAQIVYAIQKGLHEKLCLGTPGLDEQGKVDHADKLQLDVRVEDLKSHERFRLYFFGEKETAIVPAAPPGAKLVPGATVTLHYPVPKGSKPVQAIRRLCGDQFSDKVDVVQAYNSSSRADQHQAQKNAAKMELLQQDLLDFKLDVEEPFVV